MSEVTPVTIQYIHPPNHGYSQVTVMIMNDRLISLSFYVNRTNHSWDMSNVVFDLEKTHPKFSKKIWQKTSFQQNSPKCNQVISMAMQKDIATKFCSDWLSGSLFILQTSKFLFINITAVTLGQGHKKVIQYILPDLYFRCPKYLRFSWNGFDVRSKSHCRGGGSGRGGRNELKT